MPSPIFLEADLYDPLLHALGLTIFALLFPPGTFSHERESIPRWRWVGIAALLSTVFAGVDILMTAYRRGAEAVGLDGLPYRLAEMGAFALIAGLMILLFRRFTPVKPQ